MASAIEHWFPRLEDQVKLAHRIYQCLLCFQLPDKTRKLTLIGKIDSGKTSIMNFFSALIPEEKISILTKETTFGLSMITDDTELLYVDEWTREMTPPDIAKMLFQNGRFPQAIKFKSPKMRKMEAGVFLTCNAMPKFGKEQEAVERRLAMFHTRPLENIDPSAPSWIKSNAMNCLTYLVNLINSNLDVLDEDDLSYTLPKDVRCANTMLMDKIDEKKLDAIQKCVVDKDKSVELAQPLTGYDIFRIEQPCDDGNYIFYLSFYFVLVF